MKMMNKINGDILELAPPGALGQSELKLNGVVIESALFSDENGGSVTLGDGRMFAAGAEFATYAVGLLKTHETKA